MADKASIVGTNEKGQFAVSVPRSAIDRVDVIDIDLVLHTKGGERLILPGAALEAMTATPPTVRFQDGVAGAGDLLSAVDRVQTPPTSIPAMTSLTEFDQKRTEGKKNLTQDGAEAKEAAEAAMQAQAQQVAPLPTNTGDSTVDKLVAKAELLESSMRKAAFDPAPPQFFEPPAATRQSTGSQPPTAKIPLYMALAEGNVVGVEHSGTDYFGGGGAPDSTVDKLLPSDAAQYSREALTGTDAAEAFYADAFHSSTNWTATGASLLNNLAAYQALDTETGRSTTNTAFYYAKTIEFSVAGYILRLNSVTVTLPAYLADAITIEGATDLGGGRWSIPTTSIIPEVKTLTLVYDVTKIHALFGADADFLDVEMLVTSSGRGVTDFTTTRGFLLRFQDVDADTDVTGATPKVVTGGPSEIYVLPTASAPHLIVTYAGSYDDAISFALNAADARADATDGANTVYGGNSSDTILAGAGNDTVFAYAGNDLIAAGNGANLVWAGDGNDTVDTGSGNDIVHLGRGNNILTDAGGDNTVDVVLTRTANGTTVSANGADDVRITSAGVSNNTITVGDETDLYADGDDIVSIDTAGGTDTIHVGDGANIVRTGNGDKTVHAGSGGDTIVLGTAAGTTAGTGNYVRDHGGSNNITTGSGDGRDVVSITGNSGSDINTIRTGIVDGAADGDDTVLTGLGKDIIEVGDGNNSVDAGSGNDTVTAGGGNDTITTGDTTGGGTVSISAGGGANTITVGNGNKSITAGSGDDIITSATGNGTDVIDVGAGTNSITLGNGDKTIVSGAGNDTIRLGTATGTTGATGTRVTDSGGDNDITTGDGDGKDVIRINGAGTNIIKTGTIDAAADGDDTVITSSGSDTITVGDGNNVVWAADGTQTNGSGTAINSIFAGSGNDLLVGGNGVDSIGAGGGNDTLYGGQGSNIIDGGAGSDWLSFNGMDNSGGKVTDRTLTLSDMVQYGGTDLSGVTFVADGSGSGTATHGADTDTLTAIENIIGTGGNDTLDMSAYAVSHTLYGLGGNDVLVGGAEADTIYAGAGEDTVLGGDGDDLINLAVTDITLTGAGLTGTSVDAAGGGSLSHAVATAGIATNFTDITNWVDGGAGADTIIGGAGFDYFHVGLNETLNGSNRDSYAGGSGTDTLDFTAFTATGLTVDMVGGTVKVGGTLYADFSSIERVLTSTGNDTVTGTDGDDSIWTGDGADRINVGKGANYVDAGAGNDEIDTDDTASGNDTIHAGTGDDTVWTGHGNDTVWGGTGNDRLYAENGSDTLYGEAGDDLLTGSASDTDTVTLDGGTGTNTYYAHASTDVIAGSDGVDWVRYDQYQTVGTNVSGTNYGIFANLDATQSYGVASGGTLTPDGAASYWWTGSTWVAMTTTSVNGKTWAWNATNAGQGFYGNANGDSYTDVERISGTNHSDVLIGNGSANIFYASNGNDAMFGLGGDDSFVVNNGTKFIDGGDGTDTLNLSNYTTPVTINMATHTGTHIVYNVESVRSGSGDDILTGDANDNTFDGGAGADTMTGGDGNDVYYVQSTSDSIVETLNQGTDTVYSSVSWTLDDHVENLIANSTAGLSLTGNGLANTITGGTGVDTIRGGDGDDVISGGGGADKLYGDAGSDTFSMTVAQLATASIYGGSGNAAGNATETGTDTLYISNNAALTSLNASLIHSIEVIDLANGSTQNISAFQATGSTANARALINGILDNAGNTNLVLYLDNNDRFHTGYSDGNGAGAYVTGTDSQATYTYGASSITVHWGTG